MKCLIHLIAILNIIEKGLRMTEDVKLTEELFKKALDELVLRGLNELSAGTVLGTLAVVSRFTEVVYDMNVVAKLRPKAEDVE
jgi:hypothetical protein